MQIFVWYVAICFWHVYRRTTKTGHYKPHQTFAKPNTQHAPEWDSKTPAKIFEIRLLIPYPVRVIISNTIYLSCALSTLYLYAWVCALCVCVVCCVLVPKLLFHYSNLNFSDWILSLHFQAPKRIIKRNERPMQRDDDEFTYSFTLERMRASFVSFVRSFIQSVQISIHWFGFGSGSRW